MQHIKRFWLPAVLVLLVAFNIFLFVSLRSVQSDAKAVAQVVANQGGALQQVIQFLQQATQR